MALLIIEHGGKMRAGVIAGRVVVGRREQDQIRLRDKSVARIHAWVDKAPDGSFYIADSGSNSGTWVNERRVASGAALRFGDLIRVGPLLMRLDEGETVPDGFAPIDLRVRPAPQASRETGISFDCTCGAPMWTPWPLAGKTGRCRTCGGAVRVPVPAGFVSSGNGTSSKAAHCGVCHGDIQPLEPTNRCPACGAIFHVECWTENGGCSIYGCSRASPGTVETGSEVEAVAEEVSSLAPDDIDQQDVVETIPWASVLLAASIIGALIGTLTFGGTSLFVLMASLLYLFGKKPVRQRRTVLLSIAVSVVGALADGVISYLWWIGTPWHPTR